MSEIWGGYFWEGLLFYFIFYYFIYLFINFYFIIIVFFFWGGGGGGRGLIIETLRYHLQSNRMFVSAQLRKLPPQCWYFDWQFALSNL